MIQHILHSSILAVLFYGVYHFFLRKETFFQWNRAYLLAIPLLSLTIPFLSAPFSIVMTPVIIDEVAPLASVEIGNVSMINEQPIAVKTSKPIDYTMIAVIIYSLGALINLLFFLYNVSSIKEIIRKGKTHFNDGIWITKTSGKLTAFSFFKNIVIDEDLDSKKVDDILTHEIIHVKQFHSWDLMAYEVYKIIFWFHPICYVAQKELKQVHEYIVDHVLTKNQETEIYQESLLSTFFDTEQFLLASSYFNKSILKNRILMLQKNKSTVKALFKLAYLLSIVLGSLIFTACTQDVEELSNLGTSEKVLSDSRLEFLPRLSTFEYGKKDFYKGLNDDDIAFYHSYYDNLLNNNYLKTSSKEDIFKLMYSPEGKKHLEITSIINANSKTLIVDDVNTNFHILTIHESPEGEPSFSGGPPAWDSNATDDLVDIYLKGINKNRVSDLTETEYRGLVKLIERKVTSIETSSHYENHLPF
ncbi:M56 family metallopeptidase [Nonlabens sp.]|uniref:M56 family metallopeptidase n=1 Tax=Nonlabens sp. TaxID=1888209 RepID=UPI003264EF3E